LAKSAVAVVVALGMKNAVIYPTGGVFRAGAWVLDPFAAGLKASAPDAEIRTPAFPQVVGALLLAQRQAGYALDEAYLARLRATLPASLHDKAAARDCGELHD
jgi:hypothetical protein